jgi:hypothetical protein
VDKNKFIENYVAVFLATFAANRYCEHFGTAKDWTTKPPVNDAVTLAENAWDSIPESQKQSTPVTIGNVVTATIATDSTPPT